MSQLYRNQSVLSSITKLSNYTEVEKSESPRQVTDRSKAVEIPQIVTTLRRAPLQPQTTQICIDVDWRKITDQACRTSASVNLASFAEQTSYTQLHTASLQIMAQTAPQKNVSSSVNIPGITAKQRTELSLPNNLPTALLEKQLPRLLQTDPTTAQKVNALASEPASQPYLQAIINNLLSFDEKNSNAQRQSTSFFQSISHEVLQANKQQQTKIPGLTIGQDTKSTLFRTASIPFSNFSDVDEVVKQEITTQASQVASQVYLESVLTNWASFAEARSGTNDKQSTPLLQSLFPTALQRGEMATFTMLKPYSNLATSETVRQALITYGLSQVDLRDIIGAMLSKREYIQPSFGEQLVDTGARIANTDNTNANVSLDRLALRIESSLAQLQSNLALDLNTVPQSGHLEPLIGKLRADFANYKKGVEQQLHLNADMDALLGQQPATLNSTNEDRIRITNSNPLLPPLDQKLASHNHERESHISSYDPNKWLPIEEAAEQAGLTRRAVNMIIQKGYVKSLVLRLPVEYEVEKTFVSIADLINYRQNPPKRGPHRKEQ